MLFNIPTGDFKKCYDNLWEWLSKTKPEPLHACAFNHNTKYLGHYVGIQGSELEPEAFQVYDLYVYNGSKFSGKSFIAKFGDSELDYISQGEEELAKLDNKDLRRFAVGESYRRYKKRNVCRGFYN